MHNAIPFTKSNIGQMPVRHYDSDAGSDLVIPEAQRVWPGAYAELPCEVAVAIPHGHFGYITARSSTFREHHLIVIPSVIDAGFRGQLFTFVYNTSNFAVNLPPRTRLAQIVVIPFFVPNWMQVDDLPDADRGTRGVGSTGV